MKEISEKELMDDLSSPEYLKRNIYQLLAEVQELIKKGEGHSPEIQEPYKKVNAWVEYMEDHGGKLPDFANTQFNNFHAELENLKNARTRLEGEPGSKYE